MRTAALLLASVLLASCATAPDRMGVSLDHVSHPLVGWPFSSRYDEDALTEMRISAEWQRGCGFASIGIGYNLRGRDGGGFYGPPLTGSFAVGCSWSLRH